MGVELLSIPLFFPLVFPELFQIVKRKQPPSVHVPGGILKGAFGVQPALQRRNGNPEVFGDLPGCQILLFHKNHLLKNESLSYCQLNLFSIFLIITVTII